MLRSQKRNIYSGPCTGPFNTLKPCHTPKALEYRGSICNPYEVFSQSSNGSYRDITSIAVANSNGDPRESASRFVTVHQSGHHPSVAIYPLFSLLSWHYIRGARGFIPIWNTIAFILPSPTKRKNKRKMGYKWTTGRRNTKYEFKCDR